VADMRETVVVVGHCDANSDEVYNLMTRSRAVFSSAAQQHRGRHPPLHAHTTASPPPPPPGVTHSHPEPHKFVIGEGRVVLLDGHAVQGAAELQKLLTVIYCLVTWQHTSVALVSLIIVCVYKS
jgi:hypothetical protein